ncbi:hypothetical protein [Miltoncostaea oceani]|uniref:hypothetical protein n=1 Tax=Miltoncostaea oceani TaxID=2843216 RepID=UPI001C3DB280|nr:hypothetical protein [Miltoncostaea oceani]
MTDDSLRLAAALRQIRRGHGAQDWRVWSAIPRDLRLRLGVSSDASEQTQCEELQRRVSAVVQESPDKVFLTAILNLDGEDSLWLDRLRRYTGPSQGKFRTLQRHADSALLTLASSLVGPTQLARDSKPPFTRVSVAIALRDGDAGQFIATVDSRFTVEGVSEYLVAIVAGPQRADALLADGVALDEVWSLRDDEQFTMRARDALDSFSLGYYRASAQSLRLVPLHPQVLEDPISKRYLPVPDWDLLPGRVVIGRFDLPTDIRPLSLRCSHTTRRATTIPNFYWQSDRRMTLESLTIDIGGLTTNAFGPAVVPFLPSVSHDGRFTSLPPDGRYVLRCEQWISQGHGVMIAW